MFCNGFVLLALFILSLINYYSNNILIKMEVPMEQAIKKTNKLEKLLKSFFETIWAIGTSVAATGAL